MGEIEIAGKDALAAVQRISSNDASKLAGRTGAVLRPADAAGHVRRRPARLPARRRSTSCSSSTPATSRRTTRGSPSTSRRPATRSPSTRARATRCSRSRGRRRSSVLQPLTGVDLAAHEVLLVRARRSRQRPRHDLAHRLHRRGRLRDLRPAAVGRPRLAWRSSRPGKAAGRRSRAASARATRCGSKPACASTATTSTRRRRALEADLGWIVGWKKDDFIGADVLREQKAERRRAQARRLRDARPRHRAPRLRRLRRRRARSASSPAARRRRS